MRIISVVLLVIAAAGCATLHLDGGRANLPVWTTEGVSTLRPNAVERPLEPPLEQVWDFNAGAGFGPVSPLIVGDAALVANRKGEVHAIDMESGRRLGQTSFGEAIDGTPTIANGVLYVPISWGRDAVHAHSLGRGTSVWRARGAPIEAGLLVYEDALIAADVEGFVRAYRLSDGEVRWETSLGERRGVRSAPVLVGEVAIVGDDAGGVTAIDAASGSIRWQTAVDAPVHAALSATEETVFVSTTQGRLVALRAYDGSVVWSYRTDTEEAYLTSPSVGSREVVFGGSDGRIRALNKVDGAVLWTTDVDGAVTAAPLITGKTVYVGTMRSKLIGLARSDGTQAWETKLEGRIKSPFAVRGTQLVVLAEPRHVYLFDAESDSYAATSD